MKPRVTVVTLGVADVQRARRFYVGGLGWPVRFEAEAIVMLDVEPGLAPITLAHNLKEPADVDAVIAGAVAVGGRLVSAGVRREWGGYSGYVADPDGYRWEITVNPEWPELVSDNG